MSLYVVHWEEQTLAAATVETLAQVVAPSDHDIEVVEFSISFEGVTAANVPGNVDLLRQTSAGTASSFTAVLMDPNAAAYGGSAQTAFTAEPTAGDVLLRYLVSPNATTLVHSLQPDVRPRVADSGRIGLRANFADSVDCSGYLVFRTV